MIRKNRLLDACLNGNGDIFTEIKRIRKSEPVVATSIDGKNENVEEYFKDTYKGLYNCIDDFNEMETLKTEVDIGVNCSHFSDLELVTPNLIKEAVACLKGGKSDPNYLFTSDCFKNAPDELFFHLANVIKCFLVHGHITVFLLLATLVPIIKNKLGSINSSKNYRSIAISSLMLKLFDRITLLLFESCLDLDDLQYAYQEGASTIVCTWIAIETVDYYLTNMSEVFQVFQNHGCRYNTC